MKKAKAYKLMMAVFTIVFVAVLTGCSEEVKILPPLDKKTTVEECAVFIIPAKAAVKRIDGKKRGLFSSWSGGSKAATLLVPAGEHTIIFEYSRPLDGWSAKKLNYTVAMSAGKMYMISVSLDKKAEIGIVSTVINVATSFAK